MKSLFRLLMFVFAGFALASLAMAAEAAAVTDPSALLNTPISQWQLNGVTATLVLMIVGRIYNGARTQGGIIGMWRAFLYGENLPKVIAEDYKQELQTPAKKPDGGNGGVVGMLIFFCVLGGSAAVISMTSGCNLVTKAPTQEAQIQRIATVVRATTSTATNAALLAKPQAAPAVLAVADVILVAADSTYDPVELTKLISASLAKTEYGPLAANAFTLALGVYQSFYAINVQNAIDAKPAFKAVLIAIAEGAKAGASGTLTGAGGDPLAELSFDDLKLR